jgi:RNA recognition motif-containing protein
LNKNVTKKDLLELFEEFADICDIKLIDDNETNTLKAIVSV